MVPGDLIQVLTLHLHKENPKTTSLLHLDFKFITGIVSIKCPVLAFHSPDDEIVPYELGKQYRDPDRRNRSDWWLANRSR